MRRPELPRLPLIGVFLGLLFTLPAARGGETVPEEVRVRLQALFQEYYPDAAFTNRGVNGVHIDFAVTTFEFPPVDMTKKHENTVQRGPKQGGILCSVYLEKGTYAGQLALIPRGGGQYQSGVIDRKKFKQLLAAPYSPKRDAHLWISLSYPSDTQEEFLQGFRSLLADFEKDAL